MIAYLAPFEPNQSIHVRKAAKIRRTDYSKTLFLPQTEFPMRAGLPQREPEILKHWNEIDLYDRLREGRRRPRQIRAA